MVQLRILWFAPRCDKAEEEIRAKKKKEKRDVELPRGFATSPVSQGFVEGNGRSGCFPQAIKSALPGGG